MADDPPQLRVGSFAAHSARGLIREKRTRRAVMLAAVALALLLIVAGTTILRGLLDAHTHPLRALFYWIACGWVTILAFLLAAFDLLMVRAETRAAHRRLRQSLEERKTT